MSSTSSIKPRLYIFVSWAFWAADRGQAFAVTGSMAIRLPILSMSMDNNNPIAPFGVALTREEGKNAKLLKALDADKSLRTVVEPLELPCITHADGPDFARLKEVLLRDRWDYVIVTSPEAARVLGKAWDSAKLTSIKVAAVGKATEKALADHNIDAVFSPSTAYASSLVAELPGSEGSKILYPASCRAPGSVAEGLEERGFTVLRLNTYDTITSRWGGTEQALSRKCQIACFASPSSIHGWLENTENNKSVLAACIGSTSAKACLELGWDHEDVFYSSGSPGIDGWVDSVRDAVEKLNAGSASSMHE